MRFLSICIRYYLFNLKIINPNKLSGEISVYKSLRVFTIQECGV
jgi:hypothetical protein